ncbi:MAG TPA: DUF3493 domain-containing protein [Nostocaceae cyanobacterium]|nr:DUF3493 domain-containing protein [Nostocaceae cyanobacterium]
MIDPKSHLKSGNQFTPEQYARLKAEAEAPYRGLRQFIYFGIGASGAIGVFVFFFRILAGRDLENSLPSFALQLGIVGLMVFLWRWEQKRGKGAGSRGAGSRG